MYFLPKHVFLCQTAVQVVFLDVKRNKYSAIAHSHGDSLSGIVSGWRAQRDCDSEQPPASLIKSDSNIVVQSLLEKGLLVDNADDGKEAVPIEFKQATTDLLTEYSSGKLPINVGHVWNFLAAFLIARIALYVLPLHRIVLV